MSSARSNEGNSSDIAALAAALNVSSEAVRRAKKTFDLFKDIVQFVEPTEADGTEAVIDGVKVRITAEQPRRIFLYDLVCAVTGTTRRNVLQNFGAILAAPEVCFITPKKKGVRF